MAKVETMLRKAGHKKLEEIKYNDGRWYVGEVKINRKLKKKVNWNRFKLWVIFIVIINIIPLIIFNVGGAMKFP